MQFSKSNRSDAQELIDYLLEERKKGGKWTVEWKVEIAFRELAALAQTPLSTGEVMTILNKMVESGQTGVAQFEEICRNIEGSSSSAEEWTFFFPLQLKLADDLKSSAELYIFGKLFRFIRLSAVEEHLEVESLTTDFLVRVVRDMHIKEVPEVYVTVDSKGTSYQDAWDKLEAAFETFKGFLEFQINYGSSRLVGDSPRAKFAHPKWFIARSKSGEIEGARFLTPDNDVRNPFELTNDKLEMLRKRKAILSDVPADNSTPSIIADALRLYSQAMDEQFRDKCFLGLWQVLETISLSGEVGGDTKHVRTRISWHGERAGLVGSGVRGLMREFADKRNNIAHRGVHNVSDDDVNILKVIAEIALEWLVNAADHLTTENHLRQFYRFRTVDNMRLKAVREAIDFITNER